MRQGKLYFVVAFWGVMALMTASVVRAEEAGESSLAGSQQAAKTGKKDKVNVLDFEGEMIEGERKKPDLILQIAPQDLNFESLLYNRADFNDFLEVDKNTRPRFIIKSKK